jgi:hypothetical protein
MLVAYAGFSQINCDGRCRLSRARASQYHFKCLTAPYLLKLGITVLQYTVHEKIIANLIRLGSRDRGVAPILHQLHLALMQFDCKSTRAQETRA